MKKGQSSLSIPNELSYLPVVNSYITAEAGQAGFDEVATSDIRLAVNEACTHVIQTAFEPGEEQDITITCERNPSGLKIIIADRGMPFDPDSIQIYDTEGGIDRDLGGLPFFLIQQVMDEVNFVNKGWQGKELQLTKFLQVPSVETYFSPEELSLYDNEEAPAPPGKYEYRFMQPGDGVDISRCIYKTYGYTYPGEHVYYPQRIEAMNQNREMISAIALSESGEVIAHCALSGQPGESQMELGQAVVVPTHRSRGVLKELSDLLMEKAHQLNLKGLFVQAVTLHPYSQRVCIKYGFKESALLLGYAPQAIIMKAIADQRLPQRESVMYGYQPLKEDLSCRVYPPPHHSAMIERIYENLGFERELASSEEAQMGEESALSQPEKSGLNLSTHVISSLGVAKIGIVNYGSGVENELKNALRELCNEGIAVVYLQLPLNDPQTAVMCQPIERLGFFFAGIQPSPAEESNGELVSRDSLWLQCFNGPRVEYDQLQIYSDFGKTLLGYIREHDPLV